MKIEILDAQDKTKSAKQAAEYLGVSYSTYKKWAKYYGVFETSKNQAGKGIAKGYQHKSLKDVIDGKKQHANPRKYIAQLVKHNYKLDQCEICGYDSGRPDGRKPLIINFLDGNKKNHKLNNVQILCYNCYYVEVGRELIGKKYNRYWTSDYFSKYEEEGYSKYNDFKFEDIDWEAIERDNYNEDDVISKEEKEKDVESIFEKFNS